MSNYLAIATITAALRNALQNVLDVDVPGATVVTQPPKSTGIGNQAAEVCLYLFRVTPNAALRNSDLPTRRSGGTRVKRPQVALDLHYLISLYGDEADLVPQRMLGSIVRTLHAQPVLTRQVIQSAMTDPNYVFLTGSDLAEAAESIKFYPNALSLEELSKLWSVFFQVPYALSIAYQASVVTIESQASVQAALPVRERLIYAMPLKQPVVGSVASQTGPGEPIFADTTLVISGRQLRGEVASVSLCGMEIPLNESAIAETRIVLPLAGIGASPPFPTGGFLRAGVQGLQVVHRLPMGSPPIPHQGVASNVYPFVIRPRITSVSASNLQHLGGNQRSADIHLDVFPAVDADTRISMLLNEFNPPAGRPPWAYVIQHTPPAGSSPPGPTTSLTIPVDRVQSATYLVRLQIDGAESILNPDITVANPTFNQFIAPQLIIE